MNAFLLRKELKDEAKKEARLARIEELEHETVERATAVVNAFLSFSEVDPKQAEPPPHWIAEYGHEGAMQRLAVARAGWLPPSIAPAAVKIAIQAQIGFTRARAYKMKITQNNLNVQLTLPAPTSSEHPGPVTYEVRDLET